MVNGHSMDNFYTLSRFLSLLAKINTGTLKMQRWCRMGIRDKSIQVGLDSVPLQIYSWRFLGTSIHTKY